MSIQGLSSGALAAIVLAASLSVSTGTRAAEGDDGALSIELNRLESSDKGCRFTFVAKNAMKRDIAGLTVQVVLFDGKGLVDRMTSLDFQGLPAGRMRVRRFDVPGTDCANVSRILVNDAPECEGPEPGACLAHLSTASRTDTELTR
ncbi:hypothetical protein [Pararhizobium mangrovi]|uniref:Tat pathway signal protein n=1 Tax=Pararhizobium mangrovi TaxID=2590452 RepID=A0A506UDU7_9HYPH|nr:hypothetical protein [Pararhizobium mangrovi]TPW29897.1 hypothetical protein FJU11_06400 [Pararhizobium mangrovi]